MSDPIIDVADPVDDFIWPLPFSQELALRGRDEDLVARVEGAHLGSPIVHPGLCLLGSSEVFPDQGLDLCHPASHLLHVFDDSAVWGGLILPGVPGDVE